MLLTPNEVRRSMGLTPLTETCNWCTDPVRVMCQKGTGFCSQQCARLAKQQSDKAQKVAKKQRDFPIAG